MYNDNELKAIEIAEKYLPEDNVGKKLKKLGEEVIEFTEASLIGTEEEKLEEAGDVLYVLIHSLKIGGVPIEKINMGEMLLKASRKLDNRMKSGYYDKK